jgi:hypothetical protein
MAAGHPKDTGAFQPWSRSECEREENQGRRANCAEFSAELRERDRADVLSKSARCSRPPEKWLPIGHRFRTLRVSWSENQVLMRFVRNAGPDPSPKCEHFLQIEIWLTQQRMMKVALEGRAAGWRRLYRPGSLDTKINGGLGARRSMLAPSFAEDPHDRGKDHGEPEWPLQGPGGSAT